jgi:hypothetical protein
MLELDPAQLKQAAVVDHFCSYDEKGRPLRNWDEKSRRITNGPPCGRTVFLARVLDGIRFIGDGEEGWETEGFKLQVGSHGRLREFSLVWPELERHQKQPPASPQQMLDFIRAGKAFVLPGPDEPAFLQRLHLLSTTTKLSITNVTLYYCEGRFGEVGRREPSQWVTPFALLGASAEINGTNAPLQMACPILQSDVVPAPQVK